MTYFHINIYFSSVELIYIYIFRIGIVVIVMLNLNSCPVNKVYACEAQFTN